VIADLTKVYAQSGYEQSVANLKKVSLSGDNVFGDDSGALQLATVTGGVTSGYTVTLNVGVDTTTTPGSRRLASRRSCCGRYRVLRRSGRMRSWMCGDGSSPSCARSSAR
jgi:hypothetical protein